MPAPFWAYSAGPGFFKKLLDSTAHNQEDTMSNLTFDHIDLGGIRYEGPIDIEIGQYDPMYGGRLAIQLIEHSDGFPQPLATATVNLPNEPLEKHHVFVKDYSEGEGMLKAFIEKGWMVPTNRFVTSGWVQIPEAKLAGGLLLHVIALEAEANAKAGER